MKKLALIFCLLFLLTGSASAQQLLGPTTTGSAYRRQTIYHLNYPPYTSFTTTHSAFVASYWFGVDYYSSPIYAGTLKYWTDAVMEFDISGVTPAGVTSTNFKSAKLDGLKVVDTGGAGEMNVLLYDMEDVGEDGSVLGDDWHSMRGSGTTLFTTVPTIGTTYNNINVTDALLNDLFGAGKSKYSGFLLTTATFGKYVEFDDETPTLTIFIKKVQSAINYLLLKD